MKMKKILTFLLVKLNIGLGITEEIYYSKKETSIGDMKINTLFALYHKNFTLSCYNLSLQHLKKRNDSKIFIKLCLNNHS